MDYYIDIQLLPDPEFTQPILMGVLLGKFHRALVELQADRIGISFPGYSKKGLGKTLRVHGNQDDLSQLMQTAWLKGMRDHIAGVDIREVPATTQFKVVRRRQYKTNVERLRRRRMKRKGETYEQAVSAIPDSAEQNPDLPFATLRSRSTGHQFCLFIDQGQSQEKPVDGSFNSYGLSRQATIPWF